MSLVPNYARICKVVLMFFPMRNLVKMSNWWYNITGWRASWTVVKGLHRINGHWCPWLKQAFKSDDTCYHPIWKKMDSARSALPKTKHEWIHSEISMEIISCSTLLLATNFSQFASCIDQPTKLGTWNIPWKNTEWKTIKYLRYLYIFLLMKEYTFLCYFS